MHQAWAGGTGLLPRTCGRILAIHRGKCPGMIPLLKTIEQDLLFRGLTTVAIHDVLRAAQPRDRAAHSRASGLWPAVGFGSLPRAPSGVAKIAEGHRCRDRRRCFEGVRVLRRPMVAASDSVPHARQPKFHPDRAILWDASVNRPR